MRTVRSIALPAVNGKTRSVLLEISELTYEVAASGKWSGMRRRKFAVLAEHILSELEGNIDHVQEEANIFPTPESEKGEA